MQATTDVADEAYLMVLVGLYDIEYSRQALINFSHSILNFCVVLGNIAHQFDRQSNQPFELTTRQ